MAALVDLGTVEWCGHAPEIEDYYFTPSTAYYIRLISPALFWALLQYIARNSLAQIFGPSLRSFRRGCIVDVDMGQASLGYLILPVPPRLYVDNYGKIRAIIRGGTFSVDLSVMDLRLCEADHRTPRVALIERIDAQMSRGIPVVLSVGLARPWQHPDDTA